jgi:hypothetical protein
MRWCWRLYLAAPTLATESIRDLGYASALAELHHEMFNIPTDLSGLEACIAFKPWVDDQHDEMYRKAVGLGRIPKFILDRYGKFNPGEPTVILTLNHRFLKRRE